eukprot:g33320.t1
MSGVLRRVALLLLPLECASPVGSIGTVLIQERTNQKAAAIPPPPPTEGGGPDSPGYLAPETTTENVGCKKQFIIHDGASRQHVTTVQKLFNTFHVGVCSDVGVVAVALNHCRSLRFIKG